jgi:hypothetical protein
MTLMRAQSVLRRTKGWTARVRFPQDVTVTFFTCIRDVLGSNLYRDIGYLDNYFLVVLSPSKCRGITLNRPRPLLSKSFPIHKPFDHSTLHSVDSIVNMPRKSPIRLKISRKPTIYFCEKYWAGGRTPTASRQAPRLETKETKADVSIMTQTGVRRFS